jgi:hypothetical protein
MSSAIEEHIRRVAVGEACSRAGVAHDSPLALQLESEAEIADGRNPIVRTTSGVSLDERVQELAKIPKFASSLPTAKPSVCSTDISAMSQNFDAIARGETIVKGDR